MVGKGWRDTVMHKIDKAFIKSVVQQLNKAHIFGADKDAPEGIRFIQISETLKNEIVIKLKHILRGN